jgi:hypothetical protein
MTLRELRVAVNSIPASFDDAPLVQFDGWMDELTFTTPVDNIVVEFEHEELVEIGKVVRVMLCKENEVRRIA